MSRIPRLKDFEFAVRDQDISRGVERDSYCCPMSIGIAEEIFSRYQEFVQVSTEATGRVYVDGILYQVLPFNKESIDPSTWIHLYDIGKTPDAARFKLQLIERRY